MGIKKFFAEGKLKPWDDVLDQSQDGKSAPSLWEVALGEANKIYKDPEEFFKRTYFTPSMRNVLDGVTNRILGIEKGKKVFTLPNVVLLASRFGGGKTHILITIYHAFSQPKSLRHMGERLSISLKDVQVISLDADSKKLVPHPLEPYVIENFRIETIWGMLAYRLGKYDNLRHLDSGEKPVPDPNTLKELIKGKKVLILMDEIVKYAFNMQRSADTKNYGEKVITFMENLAKAVEDTDSVLVVAVQADYKKGEEIDFYPDAQYKEQAEKIIQALRRVSPAIITPVSYDDMTHVLRKRIFEKIPDNEANKIQSGFYNIYREYPEIFGVENRWDFATATKIFSINDVYPFHPKYIEVLSDFVARNKDLQRTRDAVNITRKVIRNIFRDDANDVDPQMIMPWHINLKIEEIRDNTITDSYAKEFDPIVNKDIVSRDGLLGNLKFCSKPEIATIIADVILLKTFTYETFKEALHVFPDLSDIAIMVYEPNIFARNDVMPVDIQDLLAEMLNRLDHFMTDKGRYWFSPYRSVKEIVDKMAETIVKEEKFKLYEQIGKIADSLVFVSSSKAQEYKPFVFKDIRKKFIMPGYEMIQDVSIPDDENMKLIIFLKQPVTEEEIENIIFYSEGSPRLRVNTLVVVCPDPDKNLNDLMLFAAKIEAATKVIEDLKEYYADQDIRKLQQNKLKRYRDDNEFHIKESLLSILTKIVFPNGASSTRTIIAQKAPSIIEQVERALYSASAAYKIRDKIEFEDLIGYLINGFNIDIVEGTKSTDFRYIYDLFLTNAEGPFVIRDQIEQALIQGIRNFDIAIKQDGKLYWKKVNSLENDDPISITDRAEIIPYKLAAKELVDILLNEEGRKKTPEGYILEIKYYIEILKEEKPLYVVASQLGFEKIIKDNKIIKKETKIEEGFDIIIEKTYMVLKPQENVNVKFSVESIGESPEMVELETDIGSIIPSKGKPPFDGIWSLVADNKSGTYEKVLIAKSMKMNRSCVLNILVEGEYKTVEVDSIDISRSGSLLIEIKPYSVSAFKTASDILDKLGLGGKANSEVKFDNKITLKVVDTNPSICSFLLQRFGEFNEIFGNFFQNFDYSGTIELTKPLILEQRAITNLQNLNPMNSIAKAKFVFQVKSNL